MSKEIYSSDPASLKKTTLTQELEQFSRQRGADLWGIADLAPARDFIASQGPPWVAEFPRAISLGMRLSESIVDHHSPEESKQHSLYWHHVYDVVTRRLDFLAYDVTRWLNERGFGCLPVPASPPYDFDTLKGIFSHKLAAHLAGVGWIGKNCLLLTKRFGPRVRFVTVLTDAPLETGVALKLHCGRCHVCIDACPVNAFTGREFSPDEGRELRFDVFKCRDYHREHPCGRCVSSCPIGGHPAVKRRHDSSTMPR